MAIPTVRQLCTPGAMVTSDSLVEQVAQIETLAAGTIDGREFFRRNYFTAGLELLVRRGFDRLAGQTDDGAFYLTQAMGGGKTHSLLAFGLLAADPARCGGRSCPPSASGTGFGAAKVVVFNGHQNPETLLWGPYRHAVRPPGGDGSLLAEWRPYAGRGRVGVHPRHRAGADPAG